MSLNLHTPTATAEVKRPRHWVWLATLGTLAMVSGMLVSVGSAAADSPGKPSVTVASIGGSSSLRLSWNQLIDDGLAVTKFRIYYGTSSSRSKAAAVDVRPNSSTNPVYILGPLATSKNYYIWVQPWESDNTRLAPSSSISTVDKRKTNSYGYKPPIEVFVANTTTTTAEITFRTVTGAPIYRIRATAKGHATRYAYTGADGNWVITGLDPNTKYTFTVACALSMTGGYALLSKESSAKATGTTKNFAVEMRYPTTQDPDLTNPPHVDGALWLANTARPTDSQYYDGADVSFKLPEGFDHTKHLVRFIYAKDQRMTSGKGRFDFWPTSPPVNLSGTTVDTTALPPAGSEEPADTETDGIAPEGEPSGTTSSPEGEDPDQVTTAPADPDPTLTPPGESSPATTPATGDPEPSGDEPTSTATAASAGEAERVTATLLAATDKGYLSVKVKLPSPNSNYYVRVQVLWRGTYAGGGQNGQPTGYAAGTAASDTSQALLIKTRSPFGFIEGVIEQENGQPLPKDVCEDYVVLAYGKSTFKGGTGLDVHQRVSLATADIHGNISCDGKFKLEVRPNTGYVLQAYYVGPSSSADKSQFVWRPAWYSAGVNGLATRLATPGATGLTVKVGDTTRLATPLRVSKGGNLYGVARCPRGANSGTSGVCTVDVAAILGNGAPDNVVSTVRSDTTGHYLLKGLPAGQYTIRVTKAEDGIFRKIADAIKAKPKYVHESEVVITAGVAKEVNIS